MKKYEEYFDSSLNNINTDLIKFEDFNFEEEIKLSLDNLEKNIYIIENEFYINYF